jgi:hypothetical protein
MGELVASAKIVSFLTNVVNGITGVINGLTKLFNPHYD